MMDKQQRLQKLWDCDPMLQGATIEFRKFKGWYAVWSDPRHFGDDGEFLGESFIHAKTYIQSIQKNSPRS